MNLQVIGPAASIAWDDFFAKIRLKNENTAKAYERAVRQFLKWCEESSLNVQEVMIADVARYFQQRSGSVSTKSQHLAAVRNFFRFYVERHLIMFNPAHGIKINREKLESVKTPIITGPEIKQLLSSIEPNSVVNFRDLAIMCIFQCTGQREGAVATLRRRDFWDDGTQHIFTFRGKGNKVSNTPARHDLTLLLRAYLQMTGLEDAPPDAPLFPRAKWRNSGLTDKPMTGDLIYRMFKRRARVAGIRSILSPHSFRVHVATNLFEQGVPAEEIQGLLVHADIKTTRGYFRTDVKIARNLVERISAQLPTVG